MLYRLHVRHKRALPHLLAGELNTDVFHQTKTGAGRSDPLLVFAGVGGSPIAIDRILHLHNEVGLAQAMKLLAELMSTPLESVGLSR